MSGCFLRIKGRNNLRSFDSENKTKIQSRITRVGNRKEIPSNVW